MSLFNTDAVAIIANQLDCTTGVPFKEAELTATGSATGPIYYGITANRWISGISSNYWSDFGYYGHPSNAPTTPYDYYNFAWQMYKGRTDVWNYYSPPSPYPFDGTPSYTGISSLSGPGDCPVMSGYPLLVSGDGGLSYTASYVSNPGYSWGEIPSTNIDLQGADGYPLLDPSEFVTLTETEFYFTVSFGPGLTPETIDLNVISYALQDMTGKYNSVYTSITESYTPSTTYNVNFNDWGQYIGRDGNVPYTLTSSNYSGQPTSSYGGGIFPATWTTWNQNLSGWNITTIGGDANYDEILLQQCSVQFSASKPVKYGIGRYRISPAPFPNPYSGLSWTGRPQISQWKNKIELLGYSIAFPNLQQVCTVKVPFTTGVPFPVQNFNDGSPTGMPVLADYNFVFIPGVIAPPTFGNTYVAP